MRILLPLLRQELAEDHIITTESQEVFDIDTSVYSEERWEQNFPQLAAKESLFQYIERVQGNAVTERVKVICMLKAIYCFIESDKVSSFKDFARMFNLATPEYTNNLIAKLKSSFNLILNGSSVKN